MSVRIHIKSANGYYFQAPNGGGGEVNVKGPWPREWETFTLQSVAGEWADVRAGGQVALRSANGRFLSVDPAGQVTATATSPGPPTAQLTLVMATGEPAAFGHFTRFGLRAANGKYLCAEGAGGGVLVANRSAMGPWETFEALEHPEPSDSVLTTSIRTVSKVHFLQADGGGGAGLSARGPWPLQWETFDIVAADRASRGLPDGARVQVRTDSGHYLQAEGGGGGKVSAAGPWPREWETFTLVVPGRRPWLREGAAFGLRAANGKFVEAERGGGGALLATAASMTPAATFTATTLAEPGSHAEGTHVCAATGEQATSNTVFARVSPGLGSRLTTYPSSTMSATFVAEARTGAAGARLEVRMVVDGRVMHPGPVVLTDSTSYRSSTYSAWLDGIAPGYHNVDVEWRSTGGGPVYVRNRSLTMQVIR
ncbi:MAG TPA: hypothetical protein VFJ83_13605 [Nocardioidaceae bacterium]|nr:hypothetical protein [Nocardioidaceae bacterium]